MEYNASVTLQHVQFVTKIYDSTENFEWYVDQNKVILLPYYTRGKKRTEPCLLFIVKG